MQAFFTIFFAATKDEPLRVRRNGSIISAPLPGPLKKATITVALIKPITRYVYSPSVSGMGNSVHTWSPSRSMGSSPSLL